MRESETWGSTTKDKRQEAWLSGFLAHVNYGFGGRCDDVDIDVDGASCRENCFNYGLNNAMMVPGTAQCAFDKRDYCGPDGFAARNSWSYFRDLGESRLKHKSFECCMYRDAE